MTPAEPGADGGPSAGPGAPAGSGREHGDRAAFLAPARRRLAGGVLVNPVHVPPSTPGPGDPVPAPRYLTVDPGDLVGSFGRALRDTGAECHVVEGEVPDELLDRLVDELDARGRDAVVPDEPHASTGDHQPRDRPADAVVPDGTQMRTGDHQPRDRPADAVVSDEPEAAAVGRRLAARGVVVGPPTPELAARARLGVTAAVAGIAATGSLVLDSRRVGGRSAWLLPPVHLCVLEVNKLIPTPADALRGVGSRSDALPSSLVLVTGPSRTGDIEQLITLGAHGPTALHVVLVT